MAGDEQRLRDARITVKLDLDEARRKLDELEGDIGERSGAGKRPPSPGRRDERKERENEARRERLRPKGGRAAAGGKSRRLPSAVIGAIKTIVAASVVTTIGEMLPGMISAKKATFEDSDIFKRGVLSVIETVIGEPLAALAAGVRKIESAVPVISAFTGTAIDVARAEGALGLDTVDPIAIAKRQAAVTSVEVSLQKDRRQLGRAALGVGLVTEGEKLKSLLFGGSDTSR